MKRKRYLIASLRAIGCVVLDQNGLLTIFSESGIMYMRSRMYFSRPWIYLHCYLHRELFANDDWKSAFHFIISNHQNTHTMEHLFSNDEVRSYLGFFYSPTFRRNNEDHFYNFRNGKTIGLPAPEVKNQFTEDDVVELFSNNTEHQACTEIVRFKNFISHN